MSKFAKKSFYIVATKNGQSYFTEGDYTQEEIQHQIDNFDIDEFLKIAEKEGGGPGEGHYCIYNQGTMTFAEGLEIGYIKEEGNSYVFDYNSMTDAQKAHYDKRCAELQAEHDAEFGDEEPLVHFGSFVKVVA